MTGYFASFYYPGGFALAQASGDASSGNITNILLLALMMILGIFASFVFAKAKTASAEGLSLAIGFRDIFTDWQLIGALFVSPLIFNSIYALTGQNPEALGDFLLSFQNGFFWQSILGGLTAIRTRPAEG